MPFTIPQRPLLQTNVAVNPHPSGPGRGDGYSQDLRKLALFMKDEDMENPMTAQLRKYRVYPGQRTVDRWARKVVSLGYARQCRRRGKYRVTVFHNHDLFLLALYCLAFPKAMASEINAFLYNANYGSLVFRTNSTPQITYAEQRIGLTRKTGSTTAYRAFLPINKQKRWMFWNLPYPLGIAGIRRQDMIDLDECGIELSTADRSIGNAYLGRHVKQSGLYSKSDKLNLLLAISGDDGNPMRWRDIWTGKGTTVLRMIEFVWRIIYDIDSLDESDRQFFFIMDNLRSHHHQQMSAIIIEAGHRIVF